MNQGMNVYMTILWPAAKIKRQNCYLGLCACTVLLLCVVCLWKYSVETREPIHEWNYYGVMLKGLHYEKEALSSIFHSAMEFKGQNLLHG